LARILLVRHGETEANSSERYWGKTDVALGPVGIRQAEQVRDRLAMEKIDHAYSSELKRAMTTAYTIASIHNLPVTACPEIREVDFGKMEGLKFAEINKQYPEVARKWIERSPDLQYPGGESLAQLEDRVGQFKARLVRHTGSETVLVVAHAGVLRTLICQLLEMDYRHRWNIRLSLASLSIIDTYPEVNILSLLNDVSHLTDRCG
jgi:alpha-ribazole phosphatase